MNRLIRSGILLFCITGLAALEQRTLSQSEGMSGSMWVSRIRTKALQASGGVVPRGPILSVHHDSRSGLSYLYDQRGSLAEVRDGKGKVVREDGGRI